MVDDSLIWTRGLDNPYPCLCAGNVVFLCGDVVKYVENELQSAICKLETADVSLIAGHPSKPYLATCSGLPPNLTVTVYKSMRTCFQFEESERIVHLQFISGKVILELTKKSFKLWNFKTKKFIVEEKLEYFEKFDVTTNHSDSNKFILKLDNQVFVYVISNCGDFCELSNNLIVPTPPNQRAQSTFLKHRLISFFENPVNDSFPQSCLMNLSHDQFEEYLKYKNSTPNLDSFCWLDPKNILVFSDRNNFYKYNVDSATVVSEFRLKRETTEMDDKSSIVSMGSEGGDIYCLTNNFDFMHLRLQNNELKVQFTKKISNLNGQFDKIFIIPDRINNRILLFFDKNFVYSYAPQTQLIALINNDDCEMITECSTFYQNGDYLATTQKEGKLSFWNIENDTLVARHCLPFEITSLTALSTAPVVLFGDDCGYLHVYDMTVLTDLRLLQKIRLYKTPLNLIKTDNSVISLSSDHNPRTYFMSADPLGMYEIFEWTEVERGNVDYLSLVGSPGGSTCLISSAFESNSEIYIVELVDSKIESKTRYTVNGKFSGIVLTSPNTFLGTVVPHFLREWTAEDPNKCGTLMEDVQKICASSDGKSLILLKNDGCLYTSTCQLGKFCNLVTFPESRNVVSVEFSFSGKYIIVGTREGTLYCFSNKSQSKDSHVLSAVKSEAWQKSKVVKEIPGFEKKVNLVNAAEVDFEFTMSSEDPTLQEEIELEENMKENSKYSDQKKMLRAKLKEISDSIRQIRLENESKPEVEKLDLDQLVVDVERKEGLRSKCDNLINQIKIDIEAENSSKKGKITQIEKEYWDKYQVKAHSILAFNGTLEITNFPMQKESNELEENIAKIMEREAVTSIERTLVLQLHDDVTRDSSSEKDNFLHTQFYPQSMEYKFDQINISQNKIKDIKKRFNALFEETLQLKRQALIQLNQKTQNRLKISKELTGDAWSDPLYKLSPVENPLEIFQVTEEEISNELKISVPKSTECERGKIDDDNWRERGLKLMMDGVLEVKKEFFKKEPEMPEFMKEKEQTKWTVEEIQIAEEYNKKIIQSREEFEQYKKILENEIKKISSQIEEVMAAFNEKLQSLFKARIEAHLSIIQEELTIARMKKLIIVELELDFWETETRKNLEKNQNLVDQKVEVKDKLRKITDGIHEEYEILAATDKMLEKSFKNKFDSHSLERLSKPLKRRPKFKHFDTVEELSNTYKQIKLTLDDLDNQVPEDLDPAVWERFCAFRRQKIHSEYNLKKKYIFVNESLAYQSKVVKDIEDLQKSVIPDIYMTLDTIREKRSDLYYNLEIQFAVKQGQVEINAENGIRDYSDAVLIHRSIVENLNSDIKKVANLKVNIMKDGRDVMNSIAQLEWDHKKMQMQYEDIINRMREIKNFKVSRDMHKVITNSFADVNSQDEISALEQAIAKQNQHEAKVMEEKRKYYNHIKREKKKLAGNNDDLEDKTFEVDIEVGERRINYGMTANENENSEVDARYADIVHRRRMVDKISENSSQISFLKREVDRLRLRMYPSMT